MTQYKIFKQHIKNSSWIAPPCFHTDTDFPHKSFVRFHVTLSCLLIVAVTVINIKEDMKYYTKILNIHIFKHANIFSTESHDTNCYLNYCNYYKKFMFLDSSQVTLILENAEFFVFPKTNAISLNRNTTIIVTFKPFSST